MRISDWSSDVCSSDLSAYSAQLVGSIVVLILVDSEIATPVSSAGLTLDFDGDARLLQYALAMSNVMIDDQVISSSNMVLIDGTFPLLLCLPALPDRQSVVVGRSVSVHVDMGGGS